MKKYLLLALVFVFLQCQKQKNYKIDDQSMEINGFVWKAMNAMYLWKEHVPDLADRKFNNQRGLNDYLQNFDQPDELFESLIYQRDVVDRWSWIVDDYEALLNMFQGIRKTTGMRIGLVYVQGSSTDIFAYVKYVVPGSDAEAKGIHRGDLFRKIGNQYLTVDNYRDLFNQDQLDIELTQWDGSNFVDTGQIYNLVKTEVHENPIYIKDIITTSNHKVGYLMYNGFMSNYDEQLNDAFGYFKSEQIDKLIIDLRYNPGGSVQTIQYLASMITGQFSGQTLIKYQWHPQLQQWTMENSPNSLRLPFVSQMTTGTVINGLNLTDVVFIATKNSASASESLINCLKPYINVTQIGTDTHGKYTASITMFDSADFLPYHINENHKWAIQPIVLRVSNVRGESDFVSGLTPDINQQEDYFNLGTLGDSNEPLLQTSLNFIETQTFNRTMTHNSLQEIYYKPMPLYDEMYVQMTDFKFPF